MCRYMLIGIQVVGIPSIAIAYAVDCYKALPGEIMIAATIVKNTFGVSSFPPYLLKKTKVSFDAFGKNQAHMSPHSSA
jgi:hypothetical protein